MVMGAFFYLSHQPTLPKVVPEFDSSDKLIHALAYGFLARTWFWALSDRSHQKRMGLAFLLTAFYGLFDEWHQSFVPNRTADGYDFLADCIGAFLAIAPEFPRLICKTHTQSLSS